MNDQTQSQDESTIIAMQKYLELRVSKLEEKDKKSPIKMLTENAGAVALILGLILTIVSLYDVFITKPNADRINAISQFNQVVNSVAKIRQDVLTMQSQQNDPAKIMAIQSVMTPQILNNVATAKLLLSELSNSDVGIPTLIVLFDEAMNFGDKESAGYFVHLATKKNDAPVFYKAEAIRKEAQYFYAINKVLDARKDYEVALNLLDPITWAQERAFILQNWTLNEFYLGNCDIAVKVLERFAAELKQPNVSYDANRGMSATVKAQLLQMRAQRCQLPTNLGALLGDEN